MRTNWFVSQIVRHYNLEGTKQMFEMKLARFRLCFFFIHLARCFFSDQFFFVLLHINSFFPVPFFLLNYFSFLHSCLLRSLFFSLSTPAPSQPLPYSHRSVIKRENFRNLVPGSAVERVFWRYLASLFWPLTRSALHFRHSHISPPGINMN
jgi:hypothetical protein